MRKIVTSLFFLLIFLGLVGIAFADDNSNNARITKVYRVTENGLREVSIQEYLNTPTAEAFIEAKEQCKNKSFNKVNEIKVTIPTGSAGNQIEYIEQTGAGQLLGPECFNPKPNGGFNILDTAKNRVISINSGGKQDGIHEFDQNVITPVKIATDQNNNLYLADPAKDIIGKLQNNDLSIFKIQDSGIVARNID